MNNSVATDTAFEEAYTQHAPGLIRIAFLLTGSNSLAQDAAHSVFVRLAGKIGNLDHPASYLRTCVVNECRAEHKKASRLVPVLDEDSNTKLPSSEFPDEVVETLDALQRLDGRQRAAVVLRYFVDVPDAEIAEILDCAPSTVRSLLHRAIKTLRKELS